MKSPLDDPEFAVRFRGGPARNEEDAEDRFRRTVCHDPFPLIPAALLNSSDFYNYAAATGMVWPFEEAQLKSASYSIRIGDKVTYWDGANKLREITLKSNQQFEVPANSITFIQTKEKFRLPFYIAMRFNLKINNVHRGILLGTGPLVDPGFEGHLLIPFHNLTTNRYYFHENETFVWAEFTKISPYSLWAPFTHGQYAAYNLHTKYVKFPKNKKNLHPSQYLEDASKTPVVSSISGTIAELHNFKAKVAYGAIAGVIVAFFGIMVGFVAPIYDLSSKVSVVGERQASSKEDLTRDEKLLDDLARQVTSLRAQLDTHPARADQGHVSTLETRINQLESRVQQITDQLAPKK